MSVCLCASESVCQCANVSVCQYAGVSVYQCVSVPVCRFAGVSVCQSYLPRIQKKKNDGREMTWDFAFKISPPPSLPSSSPVESATQMLSSPPVNGSTSTPQQVSCLQCNSAVSSSFPHILKHPLLFFFLLSVFTLV